jgi:hypothetical protein
MDDPEIPFRDFKQAARLPRRSAIARTIAMGLAMAPLGSRARSVGANRLPIQIPATVLALSGLNFNLTHYMPRQLGGVFAAPPYVMRDVRYPASIARDSISKGVIALEASLRATPGPMIVLAHSQGAQVATHWIRAHEADSAAPGAHRLVFILTGNPLRAEGGRAIGRREIGGTVGQATPTDTRWTVIDVARRYDGWADWPADTHNRLAVDNARAGMRLFHTRYDDVVLGDPAHTIWRRGSTTFVLTNEDPPLLHSRGAPTDAEGRRAFQDKIERAYRRPPGDGLSRPPTAD